MSDPSCPVAAREEEKLSSDGSEIQLTELLPSLIEAVHEMAYAIRENNQLLVLLIRTLADPDQEDASVDMEGNPVQAGM